MLWKSSYFTMNKFLTSARYCSLVHPPLIFRNHKFFLRINSKLSSKWFIQSAFYRHNPPSSEMKILLNTVIQAINKGLSEQDKINLPIILSKYGVSTTSYTTELMTMFQTHNLNDAKISLKFECSEQKLWHCDIPLPTTNKEPVLFSGVGVSKSTAERNCLLTVLLYLREVNGYEPYFSLKKKAATSISITTKSKKKRKKSMRPKTKKSLVVDNVPQHVTCNKEASGESLVLGSMASVFPNEKTLQVQAPINSRLGKRVCDVKTTVASVVLDRSRDPRSVVSTSVSVANKSNEAKAISVSSPSPVLRSNSPLDTFSSTNLAYYPYYDNMQIFVQYPQMYGMLFQKAIMSLTQQSRLFHTGLSQNSRHVPEKPPTVSISEILPDEIKSTPSRKSSIKKIFPLPKQAVHNFFSGLKKPLNISYTRIKIKNHEKWECAYRVPWPEDKTFKANGFNKREASDAAAWEVLDFLFANEKINNEGSPLLYKSEEVNSATKTLPVVSFSPEILQRMTMISETFQKQFAPHIVANEANTEGDNVELQSILEEPHDLNDIPKQRFLGLTKYMAKEKVKLPIADYKNQFIELLRNNRIVIVKGEPGCGKSTRIPQYTLEAWAQEAAGEREPCRIAVTQPRRIAAISLAQRVSNERNETVGDIAGYQVRLKSNFQRATGRILFCTTGILLRYFQSDQKLSKFTHIILDEAHERDVNTDLLMNLLKATMNKNPKLKLIVMSATIDTEMFSKYYDGAPILDVPGFTYPVKKHYIDTCNKLDLSKTTDMCESKVPNVVHADVVKVIQFIHRNRAEGAILVFLPGWEDIKKVNTLLPQYSTDLVVYCLHSKLQDADQWKIFSRPPPGVRKVILSTNIAETSVTIDDVGYVIDTGVRKDQRFDFEKGIDILDNFWISKASATQRAGRAGRVRPGECFRLYPQDTYREFSDFSPPEILCTSLTRIVLQAKEIGDNINAHAFMEGLPTPPDKNATEKAVEELTELELLDANENLTPLGRTLAEFQLEPKLAKVLVNAVIFKCVTPIVDIVTLFSSEINMFASSLTDKETIKRVKQQFCNHSDHLSAMRIFEKWLEYAEEGDYGRAQQFCREMNLVHHKLETIKQLRSIHFGYLENGLKNTISSSDYYISSDEFSDNDELVKAVLYSGVGTVLQHRNWDIVRNKFKKDVNVLLTRNNHKATITMDSINFRRNNFPTKFLLYINETRSNIRRMTVVRECSLIPAISVLLFANKDLTLQKLSPNDFSSQIKSDDQVKVSIDGTSIQLICDKTQAEAMLNCRSALKACYDYYIHQLTQRYYAGESNEDADNAWSSILKEINIILQKHKM